MRLLALIFLFSFALEGRSQIPFWTGEGFALADMEGNIKTESGYKYLTNNGPNLWIGTDGPHYDLLDSTGKRLNPITISQVKFWDGGVIASGESGAILADTLGKIWQAGTFRFLGDNWFWKDEVCWKYPGGRKMEKFPGTPVGMFQGNYIQVESKGKYGLADTSGKLIVRMLFDSILSSDGFYVDAAGYFISLQNNRYVLENIGQPAGSKILADFIEPVNRDISAYRVQQKDAQGIYKDGMWIIPVSIGGECGMVKNTGLYYLRSLEAGLIQFYMQNGELWSSLYFSGLPEVQGGFYIFPDGKILNSSARILYAGGGMEIQYGSNGIFSIREGMNRLYVDTNGKRITEENYSAYYSDPFSRYSITRVHGYKMKGDAGLGLVNYMNSRGELIQSQWFFPESQSYAGLPFFVKTESGWGLLDSNGNWLQQPVYESYREFNQGVAGLYKGGKWALVLPSGKLNSDFMYDDYAVVFPGTVAAKTNTKWGFVDAYSKKILIPFEYDKQKRLNERFAVLVKDTAYFLGTPDGRVLGPSPGNLVFPIEGSSYFEEVQGDYSRILNTELQPVCDFIFKPYSITKAKYPGVFQGNWKGNWVYIHKSGLNYFHE